MTCPKCGHKQFRNAWGSVNNAQCSRCGTLFVFDPSQVLQQRVLQDMEDLNMSRHQLVSIRLNGRDVGIPLQVTATGRPLAGIAGSAHIDINLTGEELEIRVDDSLTPSAWLSLRVNTLDLVKAVGQIERCMTHQVVKITGDLKDMVTKPKQVYQFTAVYSYQGEVAYISWEQTATDIPVMPTQQYDDIHFIFPGVIRPCWDTTKCQPSTEPKTESL